VKPNAINTAKFPIVKPTEPRGVEPYRLICVSRIHPKKGLIYLLEAVRDLRNHNWNVELHLVGSVDDDPSSKQYERELKGAIQEWNVGDAVHLEGRRSEAEIKRFFRNSHLFVAPFIETANGDKDGIPTSLLEAMASGIPVVATDAGSITEVIENHRDGLIVPQRDSRALAAAISDLLHDGSRRARLSENATRKISEKFDVTTSEKLFHDQLTVLLTRAMSSRKDYNIRQKQRSL